MSKLRDYLKENILLIDGAMGTYYASKTGDEKLSELANLTHPGVISDIHKEYLEAGAKLIKTNTFCANPYSMNCSMDEVEKVIEAGYALAIGSAKAYNAFVACDIGPIPDHDADMNSILATYYQIVDKFLTLGGSIFLFETFSTTDLLAEVINYIQARDNTIDIMVQFSVNSYGYTKKGLSINRLIEDIEKLEGVTAFGLNCGVGAGHLLKLVKNIGISDKVFMASPNAGYPDKIYDRTWYRDNVEYFAQTMEEICKIGVKVIGGCCGTTPKHIERMAKEMKNFDSISSHIDINQKEVKQKEHKLLPKVPNAFYDKLMKGEFVTAVEIDPPFGYDVIKLMEAANMLKAADVDIITIADSPLGKTRLDSIIMACKIKREVGIDVMPHLCCRDKNRIAIRAMLSAAYVEGIRNYLLVTGDPLPDADRSETKSVFNMNSVKLMDYVKEMNGETQAGDAFIYGGALDPKLPNTEQVIKRILAKKEAGAIFVLTQPVYDRKDIATLKQIKDRTGIKVLGGILPLVSYRNAKFIDNEFTGMNIPEEIINRFNPDMTREQAEEVGIEIAVEVARDMKSVVDGFYFMTPFNRATMICEILKKLV